VGDQIRYAVFGNSHCSDSNTSEAYVSSTIHPGLQRVSTPPVATASALGDLYPSISDRVASASEYSVVISPPEDVAGCYLFMG
jgi:hypothetical protein